MKRLACFVVFGLALWSCRIDCDEVCCPSIFLADQHEVDFESACPGPGCSVTSDGPTAVVPSLLPGDHALALDPGAAVTWNLTVVGDGEGTSFAMSFRCDEGGALRLGGERLTDGLNSVSVDVSPVWQRRLWPVLGNSTLFSSRSAARMGSFTAVVRVSNPGRARCAVDWLRFVAAPKACARDSECASGLFGEPRTLCGARCSDLLSDRQNCGACGHACPGNAACTFGLCSGGTDAGFFDAGRDGGFDASVD